MSSHPRTITLWTITTMAVLLLLSLAHEGTITVSAAPAVNHPVVPMAKMTTNSPSPSVMGPALIKKRSAPVTSSPPLAIVYHRRKRSTVGNAPRGNGIANLGRTDGPLGR